MSSLQNELSNRLQIEGIRYLGYGVCSRAVLLDESLTAEAKAIYALLCSYSGSGNTEFPSVKRLTEVLNISESRYYRHFHILEEEGYITCTQKHDGTKFGRNVYTLVLLPEKYKKEMNEKETEDTISIQGLQAFGYGLIPKAVMIDAELPIVAKAIYALYCTLTGAGTTTAPKRDFILHALGISKNVFTSYKAKLIEKDYIRCDQREGKGTYSSSRVLIVELPNSENGSDRGEEPLPCPTFEGSTLCKTEESFEPCPRNEGTENTPCPIFDGTEIDEPCHKNECTENEGTRNNKERINFSSHSPSIYMQENQKDSTGRMEKEERSVFEDSIRKMTAWYAEEHDFEEDKLAFHNLFVEALADLLSTGLSSTKMSISAASVQEKLQNFIDTTGDEWEEEKEPIIPELITDAIDAFIKGCKVSRIKNPLLYMKTCIWNAMKSGDAGTWAELAHDFA